jgi:hypothetical protein
MPTSTVVASGTRSSHSAASVAWPTMVSKLIVRVNRHDRRFPRIVATGNSCAAFGEGFGVRLSGNDELRSDAADALDLRPRGYLGHEDRCRHAKAVRSECDGRSVVSARGCRDSAVWYVAKQQIGVRSASLEGAGVLQQFEFQRRRRARSARPVNGWRASHVRRQNTNGVFDDGPRRERIVEGIKRHHAGSPAFREIAKCISLGKRNEARPGTPVLD